MTCKNCGGLIGDATKPCPTCKQDPNVIVNAFLPPSPINFDFTKLKKNLKVAGDSAFAIGCLSILANIGLLIFNLVMNRPQNSGLPTTDFTGASIMVVISTLYIIFGRRISRAEDKRIEFYLWFLLVLSVLVLAFVFSTGGFAGILFFIMLIELIYALVLLKRAAKLVVLDSVFLEQKYKFFNKKGWIIFVIASLLLVAGSFGADIWWAAKHGRLIALSGESKLDFIKNTVVQAKNQMVLPKKIDSITSLVDITPEATDINYHYVISADADVSKLSNANLKSALVGNICGNSSAVLLLNQGISLKDSYTVEGSTQTFEILFSQDDCPKK